MAAKSVDEYVAGAEPWNTEVARLRELLLKCGLAEEVKWGAPCYTKNGKNVVGIAAFKSYFGLWFFQGALLADEAQVLINAQQGKTRAMRQWRMSTAKEIRPALIRRYVSEAAQQAIDGKEIKAKRNVSVDVPAAMAKALRADRRAKKGFDSLRPGQQREYAEYVAAAKRPETVARRLEKILPMVKSGAGLNDRYRK